MVTANLWIWFLKPGTTWKISNAYNVRKTEWLIHRCPSFREVQCFQYVSLLPQPSKREKREKKEQEGTQRQRLGKERVHGDISAPSYGQVPHFLLITLTCFSWLCSSSCVTLAEHPLINLTVQTWLLRPVSLARRISQRPGWLSSCRA